MGVPGVVLLRVLGFPKPWQKTHARSLRVCAKRLLLLYQWLGGRPKHVHVLGSASRGVEACCFSDEYELYAYSWNKIHYTLKLDLVSLLVFVVYTE